MLNVRGAMLPLVPLGALFGVEAACKDASSGLVVVVEGIGRKVGLVVDDVISQQQVVIKSIGSGLGTARYLSGAAILSDGSVGLIVNVDEIAAAGCVDTGRKDAPSEGGSLATAALGSADRATEAHSRQ
jgi:two-component system chemotaxis sensor kinase CheA